MHSSRSLFGFDFVLFAGGEHDSTRVEKPPVVRENDKLVGKTIVNKYLHNNKVVNWNGLTVDDFFVVACAAGSVIEACLEDYVVEVCVVHQS
ncbi:hypothetical protein TNCV_3212921 [Trichonephila clavipes]|nr:hypothetical protein TNCV_3212921 [Trichonephila clavipes]